MRCVILAATCARALRGGETCFSRRRLARLEEHSHCAEAQHHQHSAARRQRLGVSKSRVRGMLLVPRHSGPSTHRGIPASARDGAHRLDARMLLAKQPRQSACRMPWSAFTRLPRPSTCRPLIEILTNRPSPYHHAPAITPSQFNRFLSVG